MFQKKLIVLALALSLPWVASSNIIISTLPVNGTGASLGPNVMLDLSVEFPTAKTAYPVNLRGGYSNIDSGTAYSRMTKYLGYFDPNKCYSYQTTDGGYFRPEKMVTDYYVTGGDGVKKINPAPQRTCDSGLWSGNVLNVGTMSAIDIFRWTLTGGNRALGTTSGSAQDYSDGDTDDRTTLRRANAMTNFNGGTQIQFNDIVAGLSPYGTNRLRFENTDFGFNVQTSSDGGTTWVNQGRFNAIVEVCREISTQPNNGLENNGLEENCRPYKKSSSNTVIYKPEGLIQKYGTQMRFGAFGYLNDNSYGRNGGVLRARMKYPALDGVTSNNINVGKEWNLTTGRFEPNPDDADASASGVSNSGVINYLNKFGDATGYKTYDTAAEMFYASQRYFRNKGNLAKNTESPITAAMKDSFPVITNWDDPLLGSCQKNFIIYIGDTNTHMDVGLPGWGLTDITKDNVSVDHPAPAGDSEFDVKAILKAIAVNEGVDPNLYIDTRVGSGTSLDAAYRSLNISPATIAALAWWGHTQDIRSDLTGKQTIDTFMIDVVEGGNEKVSIMDASWRYAPGNAFYLAAKYGGFNTSVGNMPPKARDVSWTSDTPGNSRVPNYDGIGGTPDNFAQANNPQSMVDALTRAFNSIASKADASLAGMSTNFKTQPTLAGSYTFQSAYDSEKWSGDLITRKIGFDTSGSMTQTEVWRAKNTYATQMAGGWSSRSIFTFDQNDHKGVNFDTAWYSGLSVGHPQYGALDKNNDGYGALRVNFLRGDRSNETAGSMPQFRQRSLLLGDIVNSSPASIAQPLTDPQGCQYNAANRSAILARDPLVAVAANDGLLHVFKVADGTEKFAYLPAGIFDKLQTLTAKNYQHDFYNDGSPQVQEICFTRNPDTGNDYAPGAREGRSVLIGSTGVGGSAVYALDVTKPTIDRSDVLWEFSARDDADMGLASSQPVTAYVRWHDNKIVPVVVFGNGPNSTGGFGALFILRLDKEKGEAWQANVNYIKTRVRPDLIPAGTTINQPGLSTSLTWGTLPMHTTPNGLGGAVAVDHFGRGVADFVYAGDLNGNVWAFNLNGALGGGSSASPIASGLMFVALTPGDSSASPPVPAARQPITAAPLVVADPSGSCYDRVLIGTGQWFSNADNPIGQQTMYGLCTKQLPGTTASTGAPPIMNVATLNEQELTPATVASNSNSAYYATSQNPVPAGESWYLNMLSNERVLQTPRMRGNQVVRFDSVVPGNGTAGCDSNGDSYITEVNLFTGAMINTALFDTNNNGIIDQHDMAASRQKEGTGVAGASLTLGEWQCNIGEKGVLLCERINGLGTLGTRLSWRELLRN